MSVRWDDGVYWRCSRSSMYYSGIHAELRARLEKDLRSILRSSEKQREKNSQRLIRHAKGLQDRRSRERMQLTRYVSDCLQASRVVSDKMQMAFVRETQTFHRLLRERLQCGRDELCRTLELPMSFSSMALKSKLLGSSSRSSKVGDLLASAASKDASNLEATHGSLRFPRSDQIMAMGSFRVPGALVEFLNGTNSTSMNMDGAIRDEALLPKEAALRPAESFHALLECFASARRLLSE